MTVGELKAKLAEVDESKVLMLQNELMQPDGTRFDVEDELRNVIIGERYVILLGLTFDDEA